jgi:WD40 repeat protein
MVKFSVVADLNLLSWSNAGNQVALALGASVYLWSAPTGAITELCALTASGDYVSSVAWLSDASILAVGNSLGTVQVKYNGFCNRKFLVVAGGLFQMRVHFWFLDHLKTCARFILGYLLSAWHFV